MRKLLSLFASLLLASTAYAQSISGIPIGPGNGGGGGGGGGGGSGTVQSGTTGQIAVYPGNGTTVGGVNTISLTTQATGSPPLTIDARTTTTEAINSNDRGALVTFCNASPVAASLAQAGASFPSGWTTELSNKCAGTVTVTIATSTFNGASTIVLANGQSAFIVSDGVNYTGFVATASSVIPNYITGGQLTANLVTRGQGTSSTTVLTVAASPTPIGSNIAVGQYCTWSGNTAGTTVSSLGTGTGAAGTYNMSASFTNATNSGVTCWDGSKIIISPGAATDNTNTTLINFTSIGASYTKAVGSAWAAGSGNGGLGNGITLGASSTYFMCAMIYNGGLVDFFVDSALGCTHPPLGITVNYTRAINAFLTDAGSRYIPMDCHGDTCYYIGASVTTGNIPDFNNSPSVSAGVTSLTTMTAPTGLNNVWFIGYSYAASSGCSIFDASYGLDVSVNNHTTWPTATSPSNVDAWQKPILLDSSARLAWNCAQAVTTFNIHTAGWEWRGRVN